jgi:hypothetical protein
MSIESKSRELKEIVATYDTQWFLGDIAGLMRHISGAVRAKDQLSKLSSPLRQLYFLGGLLISSDPNIGGKTHYDDEEWEQIITLLNEIEVEYDKVFFPKPGETIDEKWQQVRQVAMPSLLGYFNQGPLNYEEQTINWIKDLFIPLDDIVQATTSLKTADFVEFYLNLEELTQKNNQSVMLKKPALRPNWREYSKVKLINTAPPWLNYKPGEAEQSLFQFMADKGINSRFYPMELVNNKLAEDKVNAILQLLSVTRKQTDYIYYTATQPGNPLLEKPIIALDNNMYQVFEIKQVIHAIQNLLEKACCAKPANASKYTDRKGPLLEKRIVDIFSKFLKSDFKVYQGFYIDGNEQDILILWKRYAFIIEGKGYALRKPLTNPDKAFERIKRDFDESIGYAYTQAHRLEQKFISEVPFRLEDKNGNLIEVIDPSKYEMDFSIIVSFESFNQIQTDLSILLNVGEDDVFPWAVKLDDLEVFLLTMEAQGKKPKDFVDFLLLREELHGKLICMDELDICGGFLQGKITKATAEAKGPIYISPDYADIFDDQYVKGMGFRDELHWAEKKDGKHIFM